MIRKHLCSTVGGNFGNKHLSPLRPADHEICRRGFHFAARGGLQGHLGFLDSGPNTT